MPAKGTTKIAKDKRAEIAALAEITGNQAQVARMAGIAPNTVSEICAEPETRRNAIEVKKRIGQRSLEIAEKYLGRLGDIVQTGDVRSAAGAYKLLLEGGLLALGEPTSITASATELAEIAKERLAALRQHTDSEEQALQILREDAPELASALLQ